MLRPLGPPGLRPWGFFFFPPDDLRVAFLVDGFNLYHSLRAAEGRVGHALRWLDLRRLCETLLRSSFGPGYAMQGVYCFSAFARHLEHRSPEVVRRHRAYREALEATGVRTSFAEFKRKERTIGLDQARVRVLPFRRRWRLALPGIRLEFRTHEEKETDVAIACMALELLHREAAECIVLLTGDTDMAPVVRTARSLFPRCELAIAFPFARCNEGLARLAARRIRLDPAAYARHQLPDPVPDARGRPIRKPERW